LDHYTDYPSFTEAFIGFVQQAREYGLAIGIQGTKDSLAAALHDLWLDRDLLAYALKPIFCNDQDDYETFDRVFDRFWRQKGTRITQKTDYKNQKKVVKKAVNTAVMLGVGKTEMGADAEDSKTTSGANAQDVVKKTDFSKLTVSQSGLLDEISERLIREMSLRIKRKRKKSKRGVVDMGRSIRKNLQYGGTILKLENTFPKKDKYRLLILLDVSGSMDKYSFYLLKFLWSLRNHFKEIEAFAFSTRLVRITDYLVEKDLSLSLAAVSQSVTHWSGGTKIGDCLNKFNEEYRGRYLNGKTITIIMSDGLDTGEPEVLQESIQKIKLKSKKLIWLNPLKGMAGYQPIQQGMKTAMPSLSHFGSAHNFESLLSLEKILINA
jgi:uncharacterized protein with von Willebrand factor type A (vWA) domain